jgi:hypothetical protein
MIEPYNFDHYSNIAPDSTNPRLLDIPFEVAINVCGGDEQVWRNHMMPNSLVTFNRFWLTYNNTAGVPDQPTMLNQFLGRDAIGEPCVPGMVP